MERLTADIINGIIIFIILELQLIGVSFAVAFDSNLGKKRRAIMGALLALATLLVLQNYAEYVLDYYVFAPMWRTFVAAFGYSIRPAIIVLFVYEIAPERKNWWMWIPVGINAILYNTAYFTDLVFTIKPNNTWGGGPLNDLCMIVSALLLAYHLFVGALAFRHEKKVGALMPMLFTLVVVAGIVLDSVKNFYIPHWVDYVTIAVVACCVFYYLWLHFVFIRRYQDALVAEQRFNSMISQLQPHFIYNALSAISEIEGVPATAQKAISDFSGYLRENLDAMISPELVSFAKELSHVEKYVALERLRFGDKVNVVYDIRFADFMLPPLTVQMLVENAIKHGITKRYEGGTVTIASGREDNLAIVTIADDGVGFDTKAEIAGNHFGIENVRKRLEYSVGGTLQIDSEIGVGTTATITIPMQKE